MQKTLAKRLAPAMDANGCISYALAFDLASLQGKSVAIDLMMPENFRDHKDP